MADMSLGLATAPILYAAENAPEIKKIIKRRFKKEVSCVCRQRKCRAGDGRVWLLSFFLKNRRACRRTYDYYCGLVRLMLFTFASSRVRTSELLCVRQRLLPVLVPSDLTTY